MITGERVVLEQLKQELNDKQCITSIYGKLFAMETYVKQNHHDFI